MKDCFPNGFNCMQYLLIQSSGSFHIRPTHWWVQTLLWVFLLLLLLLFLFSLLKSDSSSSHLFPTKDFPSKFSHQSPWSINGSLMLLVDLVYIVSH